MGVLLDLAVLDWIPYQNFGSGPYYYRNPFDPILHYRFLVCFLSEYFYREIQAQAPWTSLISHRISQTSSSVCLTTQYWSLYYLITVFYHYLKIPSELFSSANFSKSRRNSLVIIVQVIYLASLPWASSISPDFDQCLQQSPQNHLGFQLVPFFISLKSFGSWAIDLLFSCLSFEDWAAEMSPVRFQMVLYSLDFVVACYHGTIVESSDF